MAKPYVCEGIIPVPKSPDGTHDKHSLESVLNQIWWHAELGVSTIEDYPDLALGEGESRLRAICHILDEMGDRERNKRVMAMLGMK